MRLGVFPAVLTFAACLAVSALAAPRLTATTPRDIVVLLYKLSAGPNGKYEGTTAYDDKSIRARYFSKAFLAAATKVEAADAKANGVTIDWDPITNSQDPDVKKLAITVEKESPERSVVVARFVGFGKAIAVHYDFIKEAGGWKLDDIRDTNDQGETSIRAALAAK